MARERKGTIQRFVRADGSVFYRARLRLADGSRPWADIPNEHCKTEDDARRFAEQLQALENERGAIASARKRKSVEAADVLAGDSWFTTWIATRKARGLTSTKDNEAHYRLHIRPVLEGKHVRDWTAADCRSLVAYLDEKIASGTIASKSAANVWGTATKMLEDARRSKVATLRVRQDNPSKDVEGPDDGEERAKQYLYPSELLQALGCEDIPLRWRRAIALAVYLGARAGELRALRWDSIDLDHGTAHIHEAFERRTREVTSTKTGRSRRVPLEAEIVPLLRVMHDEAKGKGLVCPLPNRMASRLRAWLLKAKVTRRELTDEESTTTKPLAWHDLRGTYCTWCAIRGDAPLQIMTRAGHQRFETSLLYIREAENLRDGFGSPFPRLPTSLLVRSTERSTPSGSDEDSERDTGFEPATSSLGSWHSTN